MRAFKVSGWIRSHHVKWDMFWFRWRFLPLRCELQSEMKKADLSTVPRSYLTIYTHFIVVKLHFSKLFRFLLLQKPNQSIYRIPLCVFVWLAAAICLKRWFVLHINILPWNAFIKKGSNWPNSWKWAAHLLDTYPVLSMIRKNDTGCSALNFSCICCDNVCPATSCNEWAWFTVQLVKYPHFPL